MNLQLDKDTDYLALTKVLDLGDDSVLPVLADWLEDHNDPRARGLRRIIEEGKTPFAWTDEMYGRYSGLYGWGRHPSKPYSVHTGEFDKLRGLESSDSVWVDYQYRHQAYLDLARVLAEEKD